MPFSVRRAFEAASIACFAASVVCFTPTLISVAETVPFFQLHLPSWHVRKVAVGTPASPRPARPKRSFLGEGPIVLKGAGTVQLGLNRYSRNDISNGFDQFGGGFNIQAERRTEQSALTISNSLGYSAGSTSVGQLIGGYRTPKYALSYGAISGASDSQLNLGGFARGISITLPLRHGELDGLATVATQQDGTAFRVFGLRRYTDVKDGSLTMTGLFGSALHGAGDEDLLDLVYRRSWRIVSTTTEVGLSHTQDLVDSPDASRLGYNFQADAGLAGGFAALHFKFLPKGFATLQNETPPILSVDLTNHHDFKNFGSISVDLSHSDNGATGVAAVSHTNLADVALTKSFGTASVNVLGSYTKVQDGVNDEATQSYALTMTQQVRGFSLNETAQTATSSGTSGLAAQREFSFGVGHTLRGGALNFQSSLSTFDAGGQSTGSLLLNTLSYVRSFGKKADVTTSISQQRSITDGTPIVQLTTNVGVVRRLSKVIALQLGVSHITQTGYGGGTSNAITANIVAPLSFGSNANVSGRANPRLPAVIHGVVTNTPLQSSPFNLNAGTQTRGYNNVLVVLDGKVTQRTDTNGEFEFRFVPQGDHTVSIEPATLAPGLIPDHDSQTVKVLGGQRVEVQFSVGNFAGVAGRVFYTKNGVDTPLPAIGISVDGTQAALTDAKGHYSIGKLTPGAHKITLVETTLPSTVSFAELSKPASVAYGSSTKVDFSGVSLGGISGQVFLQGGNGFGDFVPAPNVYVVANPGDHAAITGDDGMFLLDNLRPGKYTLEIDKDSLPEGLSVISGPEGEVGVEGNDVTGIIFKLAPGAKDVVFTFNNGKKQPITIDVSPAIAPPGAMLEIAAHSPSKVSLLAVDSDVFGNFPLEYDKKRDAWVGVAYVPALRKGTYGFTVTAHSKTITDGEALVQVDPAIPLVTIRFDRSKAIAGHTMHMTLKILGPASEGDSLKCEDGYTIQLPKPNSRVFGFDIRLWAKGLPYSCTLMSKRGVSYALSIR